MKLEKRSTKSLKELAWKLCSEYIRRVEQGICFTCGKQEGEPLLSWKYSQAGHFIHGHNKPTFFLRNNIHSQCPRCNTYLSGNLRVYTLKMIDKYGRKLVNDLDKESKREKIFNRAELIQIITNYQKLLDKLN